MSPPIRRKYRALVAFVTGCRRINKSRRYNRKIQVPIAMWSCRVEEKMTLKEVDGKTIQEFETKIIANDGTITRVPGTFQDYETSEEDSVEHQGRKATREPKVRYATSSLVNKALTWWNTQCQARGRVAAMAMSWNDFKALMVEEFCPSNEMEKLENEFWNTRWWGANQAGLH
ncbi:reverse transcriptase domain-containing protein [Tanacetum coccineum]